MAEEKTYKLEIKSISDHEVNDLEWLSAKLITHNLSFWERNWQSKSRKQLKDRILLAYRYVGSRWATTCPESYGVNVYATARVSGLILEPIKTLKTCRHVALLGDIK